MKRDEPFNPDRKSQEPPPGLQFRPAKREDREVIALMMAERNPTQNLAEIYKKTDLDIANSENDSKYRLYGVALNDKVIGFCRYYHSSGVPVARKKFPAPEGWYGMGILVTPEFRRKGIARFLSDSRRRVLKENGVGEMYSIVDEVNLTSLRMHQEFGFKEVARGAGFLHIACTDNRGILFRLEI